MNKNDQYIMYKGKRMTVKQMNRRKKAGVILRFWKWFK